MKKNKIIEFIDLIKLSNKIDLDLVTKINLKEIKDLIELSNDDSITFIKDLKFIVKKSIPIIEKLNLNYHNFSKDSFEETTISKVTYKEIRKELHQYPSYNEEDANDFINEINKVTEKYVYKLKIDKIQINVSFYSTSKSEIFENLLKIIFMFIKTFGIDMNNNVSKYDNYNIRLLLVDFPRRLDSKNSTDDTQFKNLSKKGYFNNSSGVHISSRKELVVTRKTGITGLLIHELIHMLGLDFCFNFNDMNHSNIRDWEIKWINNNNIVKSDHNIYSFIESICNTNSSYFLAIYNSIVLADKANKTNEINLIIKYFKYFYYIETIYCYIMAVKVLNYFNFLTFDSFFNNTDNRKYYQNAYVFEYVIMRMVLISDYYNMLLKELFKNNFNKRNTFDSNSIFQKELNDKMLNSVSEKTIKNIFDQLSRNLQLVEFNNFIEYFCVTI